MNIIGTGLSGLVGSRIIELLESKYTFENISRASGVDITRKEQVVSFIASSSSSYVIHLAAKTDVDGCEQDREEDARILEYQDIKKQESEWVKKQTAWAVNVLGTRNVVEACEESGKRLIYISTDFVFDGENPPSEGYDEESDANPINWYGKTKYEGEQIVRQAKIPWTILRLAYPYRAEFTKKEFFRAMLDRLKNNLPVVAITDQYMTPTFIDDFTNIINTVVSQNITGIYHGVGSQFLTPFEAATLIAEVFNRDSSLITQTTREEYFKNKAIRPFKSILKNARIKKLGIKMHTFQEAIEIIKTQKENSSL